MTAPHYDDVRDLPLISDEQVLERASLLLGHAIRRQVWLMFLDESERQLPLLIPSYVPRRPSPGHRENYSRVLGVLFEDAEADSLVVAYERRGSDELGDTDREWLALIRDACDEAAIRMRGPILVHDDGLRWVAPEDIP
ncbi:hypothetical protein [Protaetiibacter larvae]|uniref:Uncharacterized protein n=1 Tax=Protaetiibacter larvae TaxID=2592654 RepID=A0A5C1YC63_9MICO|nr:hypothetical protein [Protaetiibacter larvae]QEO10679.1 hypothetical protein FLP23_12085 [Protaetiibacter larvae]